MVVYSSVCLSYMPHTHAQTQQAAGTAHDAAQRVEHIQHTYAVQVEKARAEGALEVTRAEWRCVVLQETCEQLQRQMQVRMGMGMPTIGKLT